MNKAITKEGIYVVTHYIRRSAEKDSWIPLPFFTQIEDKPGYYLGFEGFRSISEEEIQIRLNAGTIKQLRERIPISLEQGLWLTDTGEIYLANIEDPIGDPNKNLVE